MNDYPDYDDEEAEAIARDDDDYAAYMAHLERESMPDGPDCPFCGHPVDVLTDGIVCSNCEVSWSTAADMATDAANLAAEGWAR